MDAGKTCCSLAAQIEFQFSSCELSKDMSSLSVSQLLLSTHILSLLSTERRGNPWCMVPMVLCICMGHMLWIISFCSVLTPGENSTQVNKGVWAVEWNPWKYYTSHAVARLPKDILISCHNNCMRSQCSWWERHPNLIRFMEKLNSRKIKSLDEGLTENLRQHF